MTAFILWVMPAQEEPIFLYIIWSRQEGRKALQGGLQMTLLTMSVHKETIFPNGSRKPGSLRGGHQRSFIVIGIMFVGDVGGEEIGVMQILHAHSASLPTSA